MKLPKGFMALALVRHPEVDRLILDRLNLELRVKTATHSTLPLSGSMALIHLWKPHPQNVNHTAANHQHSSAIFASSHAHNHMKIRLMEPSQPLQERQSIEVYNSGDQQEFLLAHLSIKWEYIIQF
jgi:hypothetical protein